MALRAKSVIFKRDNEYKVYSLVYDTTKTSEPYHLQLFQKAMKEGYEDKDFLAVGTAMWNPLEIDIYPNLDKKAEAKVKAVIRRQFIKYLSKPVLTKDQHER